MASLERAKGGVRSVTGVAREVSYMERDEWVE